MTNFLTKKHDIPFSQFYTTIETMRDNRYACDDASDKNAQHKTNGNDEHVDNSKMLKADAIGYVQNERETLVKSPWKNNGRNTNVFFSHC